MLKLIKKLFKQGGFKTYLEIGAQGGGAFLPIRAKNKIAVDPIFTIKTSKKLRWLVKNPNNYFNHYFEETSDHFFENRDSFIKELGGVDVVLVDGLDRFRAALNDVLNSLSYLNSGGVIVMHDCFPPDKTAAMPTDSFPTKEQQKVDGWTGTWCGDVWKAIVYLKRMHSTDLEILVLDTDRGLGIVRQKSVSARNFQVDEDVFREIESLTYDDMISDPATWINLRPQEDYKNS